MSPSGAEKKKGREAISADSPQPTVIADREMMMDWFLLRTKELKVWMAMETVKYPPDQVAICMRNPCAVHNVPTVMPLLMSQGTPSIPAAELTIIATRRHAQ